MSVPRKQSNGRFEKGQSGNLNGRPRKVKEKEASAFDIVVEKTLTVIQNGVPRDLTVEEALQHRTYEHAIGGSRMAQREVLKMITRREKARAATADGPRLEVISRIEPEDPDNADAALQILGIANRNEQLLGWKNDREWLLLELWAVQAALSRRRGGESLGEKDINEIRRCSCDNEKLRRPRKRER